MTQSEFFLGVVLFLAAAGLIWAVSKMNTSDPRWKPPVYAGIIVLYLIWVWFTAK